MTDTFSLIETILWEKGEYFLLPLHLKRLKNSASHFSYDFNAVFFNNILLSLSRSFNYDEKYKVRLLVNKNGYIETSYEVLADLPKVPLKICFSEKRTDKNDPLYYHKTTNRDLYNTELKTVRKRGFFDVIFTNKEKEITEGAITNIIIKKDNEYFTPQVSCGLLNGVFRQHIFKEKTILLKEEILYKEDLLSADKIYLINSVRKEIQVTL